MGAYLDADVFYEVCFLVGSPALARRLSRVCTDAVPAMPARGQTRLRVEVCPDAPAALRAQIATALASPHSD